MSLVFRGSALKMDPFVNLLVFGPLLLDPTSSTTRSLRMTQPFGQITGMTSRLCLKSLHLLLGTLDLNSMLVRRNGWRCPALPHRSTVLLCLAVEYFESWAALLLNALNFAIWDPWLAVIRLVAQRLMRSGDAPWDMRLLANFDMSGDPRKLPVAPKPDYSWHVFLRSCCMAVINLGL